MSPSSVAFPPRQWEVGPSFKELVPFRVVLFWTNFFCWVFSFVGEARSRLENIGELEDETDEQS